MKQFHDETDGPAATADAVIQASWRVMQIVRAAVESGQTTDLTMTQLQTLGFLFSTPGASVSDVAGHLGLQMPTTSKVVESLVRQGRVTRKSVPGNRRKLALQITAAGRKVMGSAARPGMTKIAELLGQLATEDLRTVHRAMSLLQSLVQPIVAQNAAEAAERSTSNGSLVAKRSRVRTIALDPSVKVHAATSRR